MAIYHNEVKIITRGEGRSACAAAAYIGCTAIYNDYDGIQHDYMKKQGLVWDQVFLPPMAPAEWQDKEKLWNAVEAAEKSKDSRLAREMILALPIEFSKKEWISIMTEYIQVHFVSDGMCAQVAIHDTDGTNPHAHVMLTVRPLNQDGTWQNKTEKEYLCIRNGEEKGFTSMEYKVAQADGWEKQYPYLVGKKKVYMAPSAAEAHGYTRTSKNPKSTKFGRQNPITERWNSEEQLEKWRAAWADVVNRHLEKANHDERIDHRSNASRGIDEQPTIHEGTAAQILEKEGGISERCELNRQIRKDNALLRKLKEWVEKLMQAAKPTIEGIAREMETIRKNVIVFIYGKLHNRAKQDQDEAYIAWAKRLCDEYTLIRQRIKEKIKTRSRLQREKDALPIMSFLKRHTLSDEIDCLDSEIIDLQEQENAVLQKAGGEKAKDIQIIQHTIAEKATSNDHITAINAALDAKIRKGKQKFAEIADQSRNLDQSVLLIIRKAIRPELELQARNEIRSEIHDKISFEKYEESIRDAARLLEEENRKMKTKQQIEQQKDKPEYKR
ncbi:MAG: MobA/MobL family protein [Clostridia bacterium]|nr:MobA/MobL family protein [Clostridia bacterium]MBR6186462.1 MobA/MobL family protein [Clostridia bacterium]